MKWLAISAILCMLAIPVTAQTLPEGMLQLPTALYCGEASESNQERIKNQYGELPFLEGTGEVMSADPTKSFQGKVTVYLDPNDGSYSVFLTLREEVTCLIVTGEKISPVFTGDDI